jgi:mannose/fructose/N-acetylgalactosamine-specific phosphotransferase system component IIC
MTDRKNLGRLLSLVAGLIIGVLIGDVLYGLFMGVILAARAHMWHLDTGDH